MVDVKSRRIPRPDALGVYIAALILGAPALLVILVLAGSSMGDPWAVAALAAIAIVAERGTVRLDSRIEESISLLPTLCAAVLFGPLPAMVVGAASMLGDLRSPNVQAPYLKWAVYTASRSITGAAAGGAALAAARLADDSLGSIALATMSAALVAEALDVGFASLMFRLKGFGRALVVIQTHATVAFASIAMFTAVVALLGVAYRSVSPWTLPLFFAPALAAQRLFVLYQVQKHLTDDLVAANERLEKAGLSFASALVATLDARDRYTAGHSAAVARYARDIAARMGLSETDQELAHRAGLVHDIGKVGLPPGLLEKQTPLTLDERRMMQEHATIGERILSKVEDYSEIARIVRHHHERTDGQGYPDGLAREEIPLLARIIAVADAYDAMTSDRPYREAMPSRVARLRLAQAVESQFDTGVVAAFEAILASSGPEYAADRGHAANATSPSRLVAHTA